METTSSASLSFPESSELDTRTGEFWDASGTHYEPRSARITSHEPEIIDEATRDHNAHELIDCIHAGRTDCVAQAFPQYKPHK